MITKADLDALVESGCARTRHQGDLTLYRYTTKVFYNRPKWQVNKEALAECRGHVFASNGDVVQMAPRKSWNYTENGHWANVSDDTPVHIYKKINGFLACVTAYNGEWLITTTGSFDSPFVEYAREILEPTLRTMKKYPGRTYYFEIVHPNDPHIIPTEIGSYFLGSRDHDTGHNYPVAYRFGQPCAPEVMTFGEAKALVQAVQHEGFMVFRCEDQFCLDACKLKSPWYIGKKILMRMTDSGWDKFVSDDRHILNRLDPRFHQFVHTHVKSSAWKVLMEQERGDIIEAYFKLVDWNE